VRLSPKILDLFSHSREIPKKIHLTWKRKDFLDSQEPLITNGVKNLQALNPNWEIEVSDDKDVDDYIQSATKRRPSIYKHIENKHIVEKTDLWRLLKIYNEGGMYVDIDRLCDTPIREVVSSETKCILPIYIGPSGDHAPNFSQDFMCSVPENPIYLKAALLNVNRRAKGNYRSLYQLGAPTYMDGIIEELFEESSERGDFDMNQAQREISSCKYFATSTECAPLENILFQNRQGIQLKAIKEIKAQFYKSEKIKNWTEA